VKFRISKMEVELTVVAEDTDTVGGEAGWWILKGRPMSRPKKPLPEG
jgi:hypothetical protein